MAVNNNIEKKMIAFLKANVPADWKVSGEIPEVKPDQFIVVERTGGPSDSIGRIEEPEMLVSYYHKTSQQEASDLAVATDIKIMRDFKATDPAISSSFRNSLIRLDDTVIKYRRYQGYYTFTHHLS